MIAAVANHLWQSTVFAAVAGLLAVALRQHRARVRYGVWLAASLKFCVPFALLISLGGRLDWTPAVPPAAAPVMSLAVAPLDAIQPLTRSGVSLPSPAHALDWTLMVMGVWLCGVAAIALMRWRHWRRLRMAVRESVSMEIHRVALPPHLRVRSAPGLLEPGIVGVWRPILLWPADLDRHLTSAQQDAVLAHELCHVRRHDNLAAALHMIVEAVFWFHPAVWWIGARLVEERERACDEAVISASGDPRVYAEAILNVCKRYVSPPLACVSGVSGANLRKRIEAIMHNRIGRRLGATGRLLLAGVGATAVAFPLVLGAMHVSPVSAAQQTQTAGASAPAPAFDVVSIKPNKSGGGFGGVLYQPSGRVVATRISAREIILSAYQRQPFENREVVGGPAWMATERFDVEAKTDSELPRSPDLFVERTRAMLQTMLKERFGLVVHTESRELPIYALVTAGRDGKLGPQLRRSDVDCAALMKDVLSGKPPARPEPGKAPPCSFGPRPGHMLASAAALPQFANVLSRYVERQVVDRTGLSGAFDFELTWTPAAGEPAGPGASAADDRPAADGPSLFTALQEQLGLKLEPARGPIDVIVIDRIERPSDNQTDPVRSSPAPAAPASSSSPAQPSTNRATGQSSVVAPPPAKGPAFDVASVKANRSGDPRTIAPPPQPGGRYTVTNVPLDLLIALAFQPLQRFEIDGVPDWAKSERFDIDAKADGNPTRAQTWLMLQSLLVERFKLAVHRETRQLPVYSLVLSREGQMGPQLRRHTDDSKCSDPAGPPPAPPDRDPAKPLPQPPCGAFSGAPALGRLAAQGIALETFGRALTGQLGRMVLDRTGLKGSFDLTLEWTPQQPVAGPNGVDAAAAGTTNLPSIFTAVQEQLGLKLIPETGPVSVLVVDRVERPTDN